MRSQAGRLSVPFFMWMRTRGPWKRQELVTPSLLSTHTLPLVQLPVLVQFGPSEWQEGQQSPGKVVATSPATHGREIKWHAMTPAGVHCRSARVHEGQQALLSRRGFSPSAHTGELATH